MSFGDQIRTMAAAAAQDPVYLMGIKAALLETGLAVDCGFIAPPPLKEGPPPPFPSAEKITAIQTSLFDNWPAGKPIHGYPSRYGLAVEVWTQSADKIVVAKGKKPNFVAKSQCAVMDAAALKRQIKVLRKPRKSPIDATYLDALDEAADNLTDEMFIAMINTNIIDDKSGYDRGRFHHAWQFVLLHMDGATITSATLMLGQDEDAITLAPFSTHDAGGNPWTSNVVAQSRDDRCGMTTSTWASNIA